MPFCSNCGKELKEGAMFCGGCGVSLKKEEPTIIQTTVDKKRKEIFDGEAHLCPHCGTRLNSHQTYCPNCNNEIRGAKAVSSVEELSRKIETINFDNSLNEDQKDMLVARTVRAFNIPNTKEDLMEFLDIANEKRDRKNYGHIVTEAEEEVIGAWREKFRVAYKKAQSIMGDRQEIKELQAKYSIEYNDDTDDSKKLNNKKKKKGNNSKVKEKWIRFCLCLFLGFLGAHKFYDDKIGIGILYILTLGLFGIGWFIDILICLFKRADAWW